MADIGRSTSSHIETVAPPSYHETVERLTNWGNWMAAIPSSGSTTHPMFKDAKSGYRSTKHSRNLPHDEKDAEVIDPIIARYCGKFEIRLLLNHFAYNCSSRELSRQLTNESAQSDGKPITRHDVLRYLEHAICRVDLAIEIEGKSSV